MRQLVIEPEAEADIADAHDWYERQRPGLGEDFQLCLEAGLLSAQSRPITFQKIYKNVRRVLISRFPYSVLFIDQPGKVIVIAVFHVRQNPKSWQRRL